jgi:hypothetical protein
MAGIDRAGDAKGRPQTYKVRDRVTFANTAHPADTGLPPGKRRSRRDGAARPRTFRARKYFCERPLRCRRPEENDKRMVPGVPVGVCLAAVFLYYQGLPVDTDGRANK